MDALGPAQNLLPADEKVVRVALFGVLRAEIVCVNKTTYDKKNLSISSVAKKTKQWMF
jgi:hypothetical protein